MLRVSWENPQAKRRPQLCQAPPGCRGLVHGVWGCPLQPLGL